MSITCPKASMGNNSHIFYSNAKCEGFYTSKHENLCNDVLQFPFGIL
jgi:hypothetical protein